jgi:hypothetical protein
MTTKASSTSGVTLYIMDTTVSPHTVITVAQLKGANMVGGGQRKKIDISNFDSLAYDELQGGRIAPPEGSGELVLDLTNTSHQKLKALIEAQADGSAANTQAYAGFSDGSVPPTVVAGVLQPPVSASPKHWTRSGILGTVYLSAVSPKAADNDVWRCDFKWQYSGKASWNVLGQLISLTY